MAPTLSRPRSRPLTRTLEAEVLASPDSGCLGPAGHQRWNRPSSTAGGVCLRPTSVAHAVLHPRLMERLLAPDVEGMSLLLEDRDVALYAPGPAARRTSNAAQPCVDGVRSDVRRTCPTTIRSRPGSSTADARSADVDALLFYGLIVVGTGALVGTGLWLQYRRNQAVQAWARSIGWTYVGTDPTLPPRWRSRPFSISDSRRAAELMAGVYQGRPAMGVPVLVHDRLRQEQVHLRLPRGRRPAAGVPAEPGADPGVSALGWPGPSVARTSSSSPRPSTRRGGSAPASRSSRTTSSTPRIIRGDSCTTTRAAST